MNILGVSAFYHDSAACLLMDGRLIAAAQEERFTRKKHDPGFPYHATAYCLKAGGIKVSDVDYVAFYDKPLLKFERLLETYLSYAPRGLASFLMAMPVWLKDKLFLHRIFGRELKYLAGELGDEGGFRGKYLFVEHHESHAASAFYPSPFDRAAVLTVDGVGEWATASGGAGSGNGLELSYELRFPHSLGLLYSAFTYFTGFKVNSGEYKLMGLAPYGEPKYAGVIYDNLVDLKEDGSFRMNMDYFDYPVGLRMTGERFSKLFGGPPRKPEDRITQREMDIASSIQAVTEDIMLKMAGHLHRETGEENLCLAGGVALNCVANGRILREGPFKRLWVQPASGDAGGALGAAYSAWHKYLGNKRQAAGDRDGMAGSYLGPSFTDEEAKQYLDKLGADYECLSESGLIEKTAGYLSEEKVVGWFQGRMEFGPRALGNRSILGDPRSPATQTVMNLKIKFRESFRPFAPAVLMEKASEYFDLDVESPYMLLVAPVKEDKRVSVGDSGIGLEGLDKLKAARSVIPAVTHVDYSARVQTVNRDDNPKFHALIEAFGRKTGCPVLVNTSFNVRGEPIVCSPEDAYRCFMRTEMDVLVIGNCILEKGKQKPWREGRDWRREFELD